MLVLVHGDESNRLECLVVRSGWEGLVAESGPESGLGGVIVSRK